MHNVTYCCINVLGSFGGSLGACLPHIWAHVGGSLGPGWVAHARTLTAECATSAYSTLSWYAQLVPFSSNTTHVLLVMLVAWTACLEVSIHLSKICRSNSLLLSQA